jgi:hypothetical protein
MKATLMTVFIVGLCISSDAQALEDWFDQVPGFSPSGRNRHQLCYIAPYQVLLYGGRLGVGGQLTDQTFIYDIRANLWTLETPTVSPPAREHGAMAYIGEERALLFGGTDGGLRDDTWYYDVSESTWTLLSPAIGPTPRWGHKMAFAGGDRVVLFGGFDGAADDETWIYDFNESTWTLLSPAISPTARWDHDLAAIGDGQVLLFGGRDSTQYFEDTWVYDLAGDHWMQLNPPTGPMSRYGHAMAHIGSDRAILFGGRADVFYNDTWVFDLSDSAWTEDVNVSKPSPRYYHTLGETSLDGSSCLVLFAGFFDIDDTWTFGGGDYIAYPPEKVEDLSVHLAGESLELSWSLVTDDVQDNPMFVGRYVVYRGNEPDFETEPGDSIGVADDISFVDTTAAVGDTAVDHYYIIQAVEINGRRSDDSDRVGEFDRTVVNAPLFFLDLSPFPE